MTKKAVRDKPFEAIAREPEHVGERSIRENDPTLRIEKHDAVCDVFEGGCQKGSFTSEKIARPLEILDLMPILRNVSVHCYGGHYGSVRVANRSTARFDPDRCVRSRPVERERQTGRIFAAKSPAQRPLLGQ